MELLPRLDRLRCSGVTRPLDGPASSAKLVTVISALDAEDPLRDLPDSMSLDSLPWDAGRRKGRAGSRLGDGSRVMGALDGPASDSRSSPRASVILFV